MLKLKDEKILNIFDIGSLGYIIDYLFQKQLSLAKIDDINHPCVREMLKFLKGNFEGVEIKHSGDLPARSGIGSSSSFTVGLLNALTSLLETKIIKKIV